MGLRCVLYDGEAVFSRDAHEGVHVGWHPVQVHREDGGGPGPDRLFDSGAVDQHRVRVWLDRHRLGAGVRDRQPRGDRRVGRHENLVAVTDAESLERQLQRREAVAHPHCCSLTAVLRELALELLDFRTSQVSAGAEDARERCLELIGNLGVRSREVEKRDLRHR